MGVQARQTASRVEPLLKDRVALVTGASRGIGAATARLLAEHGAAVGVNYHTSSQAADQVVQAITSAGGRAVAVQGDVGDVQQIEVMVAATTNAFGPIDTLVLNAAALREFIVTPFTQMEWEQYEQMIIGETKGVFLPAKVVAPSMIEHKRGSIIVVSSRLSRHAAEGMATHSSGKAAVDALVRSLATELGPHGVRVNAVAPGLVETEASQRVGNAPVQPEQAPGQSQQGGPPNRMKMLAGLTPLRRIAQPEDVAGAILMLASDAAGFITGAYVPVSGGLHMV